MAEDKKAFVVYTDWESQFNLLSDEEAGKLIKHIFSYVNDQNPEFEANDRLLIMAFEPIKKQLKRDLKRYETIKQKRSEAGRKSAEQRATQAQQNPTNSTSVDFVQHSSTNPTVTVTDIVKDKVTVIDTVTVKEREINNNSNPPTKTFQSFGKKPIKKLKEDCAGHSTWLESIGMKNSLLMPQVLEWFEAFCVHLVSVGKEEETEQEFKRYCSSWISSEIRQGRKPVVENQSKDAPKKSHEEIAREVIIKKYGNRAYEN